MEALGKPVVPGMKTTKVVSEADADADCGEYDDDHWDDEKSEKRNVIFNSSNNTGDEIYLKNPRRNPSKKKRIIVKV